MECPSISARPECAAANGRSAVTMPAEFAQSVRICDWVIPAASGTPSNAIPAQVVAARSLMPRYRGSTLSLSRSGWALLIFRNVTWTGRASRLRGLPGPASFEGDGRWSAVVMEAGRGASRPGLVGLVFLLRVAGRFSRRLQSGALGKAGEELAGLGDLWYRRAAGPPPGWHEERDDHGQSGGPDDPAAEHLFQAGPVDVCPQGDQVNSVPGADHIQRCPAEQQQAGQPGG